MLTDFTKVVPISVADELFRVFQGQDMTSGSWVFRGQSDATNGLEPSIERPAITCKTCRAKRMSSVGSR
jgi:hypothetical protein